MKDCIFCKIANNNSEDLIYEDDFAVAVLDIKPATKGHTLIIPKKHSKNILEMNEEDLERLGIIIKKLGNAIIKATNAGGMNIHSNVNEVAEQLVFHSHIHLLPRFKDDGITFKVKRVDYEEGEAKELVSKIKKVLN